MYKEPIQINKKNTDNPREKMGKALIRHVTKRTHELLTPMWKEAHHPQ